MPTNEISTTHEFSLQRLVDGEWLLRTARFETRQEAQQTLDDVYGVDATDARVVMLTTIAQTVQ